MNAYPVSGTPTLLRIAAAALPATSITILLLILMVELIATTAAPPEATKSRVLEAIFEVEEEIVFEPKPLARPEEPDIPPEWDSPLPVIEQEISTVVSVSPIVEFEPVEEHPVVTEGVFAYVRVQPVYPSRAMTRGIEGYVDLAFDITAAGSTTNIRVIGAQPPGVFEKAAIRALQKWKYKIPVVDGVAEAQSGMETRMRFELEE